MPVIVVEVRVTADDAEHLRRLTGDGLEFVAVDLPQLLEHLAHAAADGVRRPGSWERGWIEQATGTQL